MSRKIHSAQCAECAQMQHLDVQVRVFHLASHIPQWQFSPTLHVVLAVMGQNQFTPLPPYFGVLILAIPIISPQKNNLTSSNTRPPQTTKARQECAITYPCCRNGRFEFLFLFGSAFGFAPLGGLQSCISLIRSPLLWGLRLVYEVGELQ